MHLRVRVASIALLALVLVGSSSPRADDGKSDAEKKACVDTSVTGQTFRSEGKLARAREKFLACTQAACPAPVRKDCETWLLEVQAAIPTVIASARDPDGQDLVDVELAIDGVVVAKKLDGRALSVDPGAHTVRFSAEGRTPAEQKIVLHEGERRRVVSVVLAVRASNQTSLPQPPSSPAPAPTRSVAPFVLGGVAVVAIGSFAFFGLKGRSEMLSFQDCKPDCNPTDVSAARTKLLVADVSLGVAVVAGGLATWLFLSRSDAPSRPVAVGIAPTSGGLFGALSAQF